MFKILNGVRHVRPNDHLELFPFQLKCLERSKWRNNRDASSSGAYTWRAPDNIRELLRKRVTASTFPSFKTQLSTLFSFDRFKTLKTENTFSERL